MDILKFQHQLSGTALLLRNVESMISKSDETVRVSDYHILADNVRSRWLGFDAGSISAVPVSKAAFLFD